MSQIQLSVKHGRTLDEARGRLEVAVQEIQNRFGVMVQRVDWAADRNGVTLSGPGFEVALRVDPVDVHVTGDIPLLGKLIGSSTVASLKSLVQQTFQKRLT
jgi:hypothetical protein